MRNFDHAPELFRSTAYYYARYRLPYPSELLNKLKARFELDGSGTLLDMGCGTGQLAIALSRWFDRVIAVDASPEMIEEAEQAARNAGASNMEFHVALAEDFPAPEPAVRLVTFGQALHWMDIDLVLRRCCTMLAGGGGVAIVGSRSIWGGDSDWELAVMDTVRKWLGNERRAGAGVFPSGHRGFEDALADAGFASTERGVIQSSHQVDTEFIVGHLYSTSYCNRALLGQDADKFEADLKRTLLEIEPSGVFEWSPGFNYLFATRP